MNPLSFESILASLFVSPSVPHF